MTRVDQDKDTAEEEPSFFQTLFGVNSGTHDYTSGSYTTNDSISESSDSREDYPYLNQRHSQLSSFDSQSSEEERDDRSLEKFDRELRASHTQACKYMRVSSLSCGDGIDRDASVTTTCVDDALPPPPPPS